MRVALYVQGEKATTNITIPGRNSRQSIKSVHYRIFVTMSNQEDGYRKKRSNNRSVIEYWQDRDVRFDLDAK